MKRRVERCPCGSHACQDWHVHPEVALQGTGFRSERRARLVARYLDLLDEHGDDLNSLSLEIGRTACERQEKSPGQRVAMVQVALLDELDPDRAGERENAEWRAVTARDADA